MSYTEFHTGKFKIVARGDEAIKKYIKDNSLEERIELSIDEETNKIEYLEDTEPFNGEEYYEASGELLYLEEIKKENSFPEFVINLDSPCHKDGKNAVSFYNCDHFKEAAVSMMKERVYLLSGNINIESEINCGTKISVEIPIVE